MYVCVFVENHRCLWRKSLACEHRPKQTEGNGAGGRPERAAAMHCVPKAQLMPERSVSSFGLLSP